ncbi:hypothetical protein [Vibrio hippocampi]|uniref:Uncharacterized protein n=1 Tax=Vibrio hippocampi TaxID=654686 RepID=A0ABN8DFK4_9VIBR|nr:hypothetical protein [Vibrio hippocampi]CAH0526051.1 hypothetical protein VHP8226_01537 [Vibrio hippocampi]
MKKWILASLLSSAALTASAQDTQCLEQKYDAYVDASIVWYQDLTQMITQQQPQLQSVSDWFLNGRKNHFEFNRQAVHYFLKNSPEKVATDSGIESWLRLDQAQIKQLSQRNDLLGKAAALTYSDRQSQPHQDNYQLRSALADLLSHPQQIDTALTRYNTSIADIEATQCP